MIKLLKYWNQNKRKIIITISVIALVFVIIKVANGIIKKQNEEKRNNPSNTSKVENIENPNQSTITGQELPENTTEQNTEIIKTFVNYCNNNQTQKAYEMLSDGCKEEFSNNVNSFINNYQAIIFKTRKTYKL